jgi:hypothetical protein
LRSIVLTAPGTCWKKIIEAQGDEPGVKKNNKLAVEASSTIEDSANRDNFFSELKTIPAIGDL